jgi:hypothetical protein
MIIRSTIKNVYYPRPEKHGHLIDRSRRIHYIHGALLIRPKS